MLGNLLLTAGCSVSQAQRNASLQSLNIEYQTNTTNFINDLFTLICNQDRTHHILAYSYLKRLIKDSQKHKIIQMSKNMQGAFRFWYQKERSRSCMQEVYGFQKQNVVQLNALYLSLNSSGRYREQFVDSVPLKICQLFSKGNKGQLFAFLIYYAQVLKNLVKYRVGNVNSKRSAMGSIMLLKITSKLNPQNSHQASLWLDFTINFSRINNWTPDRNFFIDCLTKYKVSKDSLMTLLQFLSSNFGIIWNLEDQCRILQGLTQKMQICQAQIQLYQCKDIETILKCLKSFLNNFFVSDKTASNAGQALIIQYIYSYEQFQVISRFIINMIQHFSVNNSKQTMGNLSQMIVEYSTQILRLYSGYLKQEEIQSYSKRFMESFGSCPQYEKIFVFFSALPKFVLQMFDYQQGVHKILNGSIQLSQKYQPVYISFLTHYITINDYLEDNMVLKVAQFFFRLIQKRTQLTEQIMQAVGTSSQEMDMNVERISLSVYAMSKLCKFKCLADCNSGYFEMITDRIFQLLLKSANDFSILVDAIGQFIRESRPQWDQKICLKAMMHLTKIYEGNLKDQQVIYYQIQIQLYRIMKRTLHLQQSLSQLSNTITSQNQFIGPNHGVLGTNEQIQFELIIALTNLGQKSDSVKQQIVYFLQQVAIQTNKITHQANLKHLQNHMANFFNKTITDSTFIQLNRILRETSSGFPETTRQNNLFQKLQIGDEEYAITDSEQSRRLHFSCVKLLLQLTLHQKHLPLIFEIIAKSHSPYLSCIWQAIEILYPGKIQPSLIPLVVKQRLQKIRTGGLLELLQGMDLNNQQLKMKNKQTPLWYQLYRNILREDSIVNQLIFKIIAD